MKLPLSWLREFVDVDLPVDELARRLIDATAEVESWETIGAQWDAERIRVAEVVAVDAHPNADRLRLATVETATGRQQVVCGAPNLAVGQKVAFATEGARLIDGHTGETATLKLRPIRGVDSAGMVLSEKELGLSDNHEGILVLPADAPVGRSLVELLGDVVFDISTWANRADLLGVMGFGREVSALTGKPLREPGLGYGESEKRAEDLVTVRVEDADLCKRLTASVVEGVKIGPSPAWMQERLQRMGMRPINNVVDITNYVMLETGQPLHAFDYDLVRGKTIVARRAKSGERLTTLDGIERELGPEMLVICDGEGPVGIAGVMGGGNSEVSEKTTTVLLEVANFRAGSIRATSTALKLRTEASSRFEKGLGAEMAEYAQNRALHLFEQIAGGRVAKGIVDVFPGKETPRTVIVTGARIEQVLGIPIPTERVREILTALGYVCHHLPPDRYSVQPPYWRPDIEIADDVIEDLIRIYGYENLPTTTLRGPLPDVEPRPLEDMRERIRDLAAGLGLQEIITYSLGDGVSDTVFLEADDALRRAPLSVVNPVAAQHQYLRTTLRGDLMRTYAANRHSHEGPLRLFEIGLEYLPRENDLPHERPVLCAAVGGTREGRWPRPTSDQLDFYDAKGVVEGVLGALGVGATYQPGTHAGFLSGHTADVLAGKTRIGVIGQVHPGTAAQYHVTEPVFVFELWLEELVQVLPGRPAYVQVSKFPEVRQDLALLVDVDTPSGKVLEIARSHRANGVRLVAEVFDDYRGQGVPDGKKSLAMHLRYQAEDRTLTDGDVTRIQQGLLKRLEKETGAVLRGV
jgi:phenylalanyl-tRNA synthetase beta chain